MEKIYQHLIDLDQFNEDIDLALDEIQKYVSMYFQDLEISKFWINSDQGNDNDKWHFHAGSTAVAILYLNVPAGSCHIEFREKDQNYKINPIDGMLLIFRGDLEHRVPYPSNAERISLAVNFKRKNTINITEKAAEIIKDTIHGHAGISLRKKDDSFYIEKEKEPLSQGDQILYQSKDIKIWIEGSLLSTIDKIDIDYVSENFVFINT